MSKIKITIEDDDGQLVEKLYNLPNDLKNIDDIDEAVEDFKNIALPQIEETLLIQAQKRNITAEKKTVPNP